MSCVIFCQNSVCLFRGIDLFDLLFADLWNDALESVKPFDESTYDMIMQFIERLPGLICFVAHNGNRFDYPVFLSELDKLKKVILEVNGGWPHLLFLCLMNEVFLKPLCTVADFSR